MRRRVTFSRNVTLSLSRTCVSHCKYCAFQTHQPHLHAPDEVEALLDGAARRSVKELLVLTGDDPAHHPGRARAAGGAGLRRTSSATSSWACERALERGLLPHTNLGALSREELARLREVTASQGLMLESMRDDLVAHQGSPTKDPALRLQTIREAGELRIPFTSAGSSSGSARTRRTASPRWRRWPRSHAEHGHLQEVILQNFVPHERYYGAGAGRDRDRGGAAVLAHGFARGGRMPVPLPAWASPIDIEEMQRADRASAAS